MRRWKLYALGPILGILALIVGAMVIRGVLHRPGAHLLEPREIGEAFFRVARWKLPEPADNLRAIYWRERHRAIFVTFETDPNGVAYVVDQCDGPTAETVQFDPNTTEELRGSGAVLFAGRVQMAQEKLGVQFFSMAMIESGQWLRNNQVTGSKKPMYEVFIDDRNGAVYLKVLESRY